MHSRVLTNGISECIAGFWVFCRPLSLPARQPSARASRLARARPNTTRVLFVAGITSQRRSRGDGIRQRRPAATRRIYRLLDAECGAERTGATIRGDGDGDAAVRRCSRAGAQHGVARPATRRWFGGYIPLGAVVPRARAQGHALGGTGCAASRPAAALFGQRHHVAAGMEGGAAARVRRGRDGPTFASSERVATTPSSRPSRTTRASS